MKHIMCIVLIFLSFCFLWSDEVDKLLNAYTSEELVELVSEAIIEPIEKSFSTITGSEKFIKQFLLNRKEQDMVGIWGFNGIVTAPKEGDGAGTSICFLPNRYFYVYKGSSNELGYVKYIVGYWKVEDSILMIQFLCRLKTLNSQSENLKDRYSIEYMNNCVYYSIFVVPEYKKYYINTKSFDWSAIPKKVCEFYQIKYNDSPRGRLLFDTLGVPPGDLRIGSRWGNFLLNPQRNDEYILELVNVWL